MMISQNNSYQLKMFYGDRLRLPISNNPNDITEFDTFKIILLRVRELNDNSKNNIIKLDETRSCYSDSQKSLIRRYKKFYQWMINNANKDFLCIALEDYLWQYVTSKVNEVFVNNNMMALTHRYYSARPIKFFTDFDLIPLPSNYTKKTIKVYVRDYILSKTTFVLYELDYPGGSIF